MEEQENVIKSFPNVQFAKIKDAYDIELELNANKRTISLKFMNKTNTKTYSQSFDTNKINQITSRCQLSTKNLCALIIDQMSSSQLIEQFCRIYIYTDVKQAIAQYEKIKNSHQLPDAEGIFEHTEEKFDENNNKDKSCLLFVIHFNHSKYFSCNYCFLIMEKHLTDTKIFLIKFNELKQDNNTLKKQLNEATQKIHLLTQRVQELELMNKQNQEQQRNDNKTLLSKIDSFSNVNKTTKQELKKLIESIESANYFIARAQAYDSCRKATQVHVKFDRYESKSIQVENNGKSVKKLCVDKGFVCAYSSVGYCSGIVSWKIKVIKTENGHYDQVGIVKKVYEGSDCVGKEIKTDGLNLGYSGSKKNGKVYLKNGKVYTLILDFENSSHFLYDHHGQLFVMENGIFVDYGEVSRSNSWDQFYPANFNFTIY
eukprot:189364_1